MACRGRSRKFIPLKGESLSHCTYQIARAVLPPGKGGKGGREEAKRETGARLLRARSCRRPLGPCSGTTWLRAGGQGGGHRACNPLHHPSSIFGGAEAGPLSAWPRPERGEG